MSERDELREVCAEAARRGGAVLRERFGQRRTIEYKGGIDLVTDADKASEEALLGFLRARFPDVGVLAEESGASGEAGRLRFVVDPLDGTTNYAHGLPVFACNVGVMDEHGLAAGATYDPLRDELFTAARGEGATLDGTTNYAHGLPIFACNVGVMDEGGLAAGATYDPLRDELFTAARGEGATLNGEPLRVSGAAELRRSLLCTGFPYDIHEHYDLPLRLFGAFMVKARAVRRLGSAALDLAYVAAGRLDGFWEMKLKPWDISPGILLVREAGGLVSDLDGGEGMLESGDVVAATPVLHPLLLGTIAEVKGRGGG